MSTVSSTTSLLSSTYSSGSSSTNSTSTTSDIDWSGLIEEAVAAKLAKADTIEVRISDNEAKIAAYTELQSLLSDLADAADALRAASGTSSISTDAFAARAAYLTANGDVDADNSMGATVDNGSATGSYEITISQLALANKVAGSAFGSSTDELGYAGVISLGTDAGTSSEISITADMTLDEIAEAINDDSDASGVKASVLKVSDTDYRLVLSGVNTGETISASDVSGDDVLNELGILDGSAFADELQAAQQASFTIDGIEMTRSSNTVDDAIDGVTLLLYQETPDDTSITLEVGTDLSTVKDAISTLVDAYNTYREFHIDQTAYVSSDDSEDTTDDTDISTGTLFADGTARNISTSVYSALTSVIDEDSMALIGLSFDENNYLELDEDVLDNALIDDPEAVESLLTFSMESSSSKLLLLARGSALPDDFTLDIEVDANGEISSVSVSGDDSLFTVSGSRIIGAEGSDYEGYTFVFAGSNSTSVDLSFGTGLAELLYNATETVADENDGTLETLIEDLDDTNDTLQADVDDITERTETYRTNLTNRYAQYQSAIESAEAMLDYLTTLIDTWNSSS